MGVCNTIIKCLLIIFNILFGIWGMLGCAFSIWLLSDSEFQVNQDRTNFIISVVIILIISVVLVLVAFIGIYGTINSNVCLLVTFFSLLLMVCVVEWSTTIWAYANADSLEDQIHKAVKMTVEQEYGSENSKSKIFDTFQMKLQCCGADKPSDWAGNNQPNYGITSHTDTYKIPESCCRPEASKDQCELATKVPRVGKSIDYNVIYDKGCYDLVVSTINDNKYVIIGVLAAIFLIQLLALIFSLVLAYMSNKANRYKA